MLLAILLLTFLVNVESTSNSRVTRQVGALPPKYLDIPNFRKCLVDYKLDGQESEGYCFPMEQPNGCPKKVWRKLKRAYKPKPEQKEVKLVDDMPYVKRNRKWVPICGHYFWDNHNGAKLFCKELGFSEGKIIGGLRGGGSVTLQEDALKIGECYSGNSWLGCKGPCNDLGIGGQCAFGQKCNAGSRSGVKIECNGERKKRSPQSDGASFGAPAPRAPAPRECTANVPAAGGSAPEACKFPFTFKTETYYSCTKDHTINNKAWCETINNWKKDCNPGCPGVDYNPPPPPIIGGNAGLAPEYQRCLADQKSSSEKCLPLSRPDNCRKNIYDGFLKDIFE